MAKNELDLTIVILSFNSVFWLEKTLTTLKKKYIDTSSYKIKTIVVDNASSDGSPELVSNKFKWAELIQNKSNIGYAAGNNVALKTVQSKYSMLLNSDVEFTNESNLDILLDYMEQNIQAAVITPAVKLVDGTLDPACHRGEPTLWASFSYFAGLEKMFKHSTLFAQYHQWYKDLDSVHQIDACSGAAMIVRTVAMNRVGLLDERFFMYAEDLDWCKRFREAGYQIIFNPQVSLIHHKYKSGLNSSSKQVAKKTSDYFYDTMLQYYDKHYHQKHNKVIRFIIKNILHLKKGAK